MPTDFPARGQKKPQYWDEQLQAYIDEAPAVQLADPESEFSVGVRDQIRLAGGVISSENYPSVQAAINALAALGGGTVMLPPGPTYVGSSGLHLLSRITLAGPHCRHTTNALTAVDGSGYLRPQGVSPSTGLAAYDGAYLVPTAGSAGPMVWASDYDYSYTVRDLLIFGVDVYGTNITPTPRPSWATTKASWVDTNASTNSTTMVQFSGVQVMPQMIGKVLSGAGITPGTTILSVNTGLNQATLSATATATASGVTLSVSGGLTAPNVGQAGRTAISFGSGIGRFRSRSLIDNVLTWGCGSGGAGTTANNRTWAEPSAATTNASNLVTLSSIPASPLMVSAPVTGPGIQANTVVSAVDPGAGILALSKPATASASGVALTIGGSTHTTALQQVYVGTPAIYVGTAETVMRGVSVFFGAGDGLVIDNQDCQIDEDNLLGFNHGWGLRTTINSGPVRAPGAIDSFANGWYAPTGAGNAYIEGMGHRFFSLQLDTGGKQNLLFGRCMRTSIYNLVNSDSGAYWASSGVHYNNIEFAAPAASTSNPNWNNGGNNGITIFGGAITSAWGFENHAVFDSASVPSQPAFIGFSGLAGQYFWHDGAVSNSAFAGMPGFATNFRTLACPIMPDKLSAGGALPPILEIEGSSTNLLVVDGGGTAYAGIGPRGQFFHRVTSQTLGANGAVTINAQLGDVQVVALSANATSSTITNPKPGQILTIEWIQDGTGSRTYVWPTNCKFAGGAAPVASTAINYGDSVTFWYDANNSNWREVSRAPAIR